MKSQIKDYLNKMEEIRENIIEFIENTEDDDINKDEIINIIKEENKHDIRLILRLMVKLYSNHLGIKVAPRIEDILINLKDQILEKFTNSEIFDIFKSNKRILLFLIEEKMLTFDKDIAFAITQGKYLTYNYPSYFLPELKPFSDSEFIRNYKNSKTKKKDDIWIQELNQEIEEDFYIKRKDGVNDSYVCNLIRDDKVEDFISYLTRTGQSCNSKIKYSIFETNPYLLKCHNVDFIMYAAFYGSFQIFQFITKQDVKLLESMIWYPAVHGGNPEIIHLLESMKIIPDKRKKDEKYRLYLTESIKCHQNQIANYIPDVLMERKCDPSFYTYYGIKYYNFGYIDTQNYEKFLVHFCTYDYYTLVNMLLISLPCLKVNEACSDEI